MHVSLIIWLATLLIPAALAAAQTTQRAAVPGRDEPARVDGRVEPTTMREAPRYETEAERVALIQAANAKRNEMRTKFPLPVAICRRVANGSIKIDGKLDDPAWKRAAVMVGFQDPRTGEPETLPTKAWLAWDAAFLYVAFDAADTDIVGTIKDHDGELWRDDAAEVFIDANADEMSYIELTTNPVGTRYDASVADYRPTVTWELDPPTLDVEKSIRTFRLRSSSMVSQVQGTLNQSGDIDQGWTCEMAISWDDIARGTNVRRMPPRDGDGWRMGLYRININSGDLPDEYTAWSPTGTWFHRPWQFGRVVFVE